MNHCCQSRTKSTYENLLTRKSGKTSFLTPSLFKLFAKFSDSSTFFRTYSDIRVANLKKYVTAQSSSFRCPDCGDNATLVVLSSPLLLLIWRISMIFMRCIKRWEFKEDKIIIERFDPSEEIKNEFNKMIEEYLTGVDVLPLDFETELSKINNVPQHCQQTFFSLIDLAQMWVISHEVSHSISDDILSQVIPEFMAIRIGSKNFVEDFDLYPRTTKMWEDEFNADLTGILLLYITEFKRLKMDASHVLSRETIGSHLAGAVGLACEAMFHIVRKVFPFFNADPNDLKHPPLEIRWAVSRNYISQISHPRNNVSLFYLAETIAKISHSFIK